MTYRDDVTANIAAATGRDPRAYKDIAACAWPEASPKACEATLGWMRRGERLTLENLEALARGLNLPLEELTRQGKTCELCTGVGNLCTNGRCTSCHADHCTPGGNSSPGHGRRRAIKGAPSKPEFCGLCELWTNDLAHPRIPGCELGEPHPPRARGGRRPAQG